MSVGADSAERQEGCLQVLLKGHHLDVELTEEASDLVGRTVPATDPDNLGGRAADEAALVEISVLGYDHEPFPARIGPDDVVVRGGQAHLAHMGRTGIQIR